MFIKFNDRNLSAYINTYPILREMLMELIYNVPNKKGVYVQITSLDRTEEEDKLLKASGIHSSGPPWRAIDIVIRGIINDQEEYDRISKVLNDKYEYDFKRPNKYNVAYSNPHGTGKHIHLQCHANTRRK